MLHIAIGSASTPMMVSSSIGLSSCVETVWSLANHILLVALETELGARVTVPLLRSSLFHSNLKRRICRLDQYTYSESGNNTKIVPAAIKMAANPAKVAAKKVKPTPKIMYKLQTMDEPSILSSRMHKKQHATKVPQIEIGKSTHTRLGK